MASTELPIGLPKSLQYFNPPQIPDSVKAYVRNIQATNNPIVQGSTDLSASNAFALSGSIYGNTSVAFNSTNINFVIPTGKSKQYLDAKETTVSFRCKWTVTTDVTGTDVTTASMQLISSAASWFSSAWLNNGQTNVDKVDNYDILQHMLISSTINQSERYALSAMGCDTDTMTGHDLPLVKNTINSITYPYYFNYCIPLLSLIGLNSPDQLIPIGEIDALELQLTTANNIPFASYSATQITGFAVSAPILDQFKLNCRIVDVGDTGAAMLYKIIPDKEIALKATSYLSAMVSIPTNAVGDYAITHNIKANSIKSLFYTFSQGTVAGISPNGNMDSFNIGLTKAVVNAGGMVTATLDPTHRPQDAFMYFMHALGGASLKSMGGILDRNTYGSSLFGNSLTDKDNSITTVGSGKRNTGQTVLPLLNKYPSCHYLGFNMEQVFNANTLFAGVNTNGTSGVQLDITLSSPLTYSVNCYCFALVDVVIKINRETRQFSIFK